MVARSHGPGAALRGPDRRSRASSDCRPSWRRRRATSAPARCETFWYVTFPLLAPATFSAFLIAATISFDEYAVASFLVGEHATFPVYLFGQLRFPRQLPQVIAVAVLVMVVSLLVVLVAEIGRRFGERALDRE